MQEAINKDKWNTKKGLLAYRTDFYAILCKCDKFEFFK